MRSKRLERSQDGWDKVLKSLKELVEKEEQVWVSIVVCLIFAYFTSSINSETWVQPPIRSTILHSISRCW